MTNTQHRSDHAHERFVWLCKPTKIGISSGMDQVTASTIPRTSKQPKRACLATWHTIRPMIASRRCTFRRWSQQIESRAHFVNKLLISTHQNAISRSHLQCGRLRLPTSCQARPLMVRRRTGEKTKCLPRPQTDFSRGEEELHPFRCYAKKCTTTLSPCANPMQRQSLQRSATIAPSKGCLAPENASKSR